MTMMNDGHKHQMRIESGIVKCFVCGHTKEELRHSTPVQPPVAAPRTVVAAPSFSLKTALQVSEFLTKDTDPLVLSVEIVDSIPVVKFQGMWDGKWLKAAVKALEHEYRKIRHNTTRAAIQQSVRERSRV